MIATTWYCDEMETIIHLITSDYALVLFPLVLGALGWAWRRWVRSRIQWERARDFLDALGPRAQRAVLAVHQSYTEAIRAGRADGVLSAEERHEALQRALGVLRTHLGWSDLVEAVGLDAAENHARVAVESAVAEGKVLGWLPRTASGSTRSRA